MSPLAQYVFVFFTATVPPIDHSYYEKLETTTARYESIAETIATVSLERPLFTDDADGIKTAMILGSIATFESFLRADIDSCKKGGDPNKDGVYQAWTLWQLHANKTKVCSNRLEGARYAREAVRFSLKTCISFPAFDRLSVYTDGVCKKDWNRSKHRMKRATDWIDKHPFSL